MHPNVRPYGGRCTHDKRMSYAYGHRVRKRLPCNGMCDSTVGGCTCVKRMNCTQRDMLRVAESAGVHDGALVPSTVRLS